MRNFATDNKMKGSDITKVSGFFFFLSNKTLNNQSINL